MPDMITAMMKAKIVVEGVKCPYCGQMTRLVGGDKVYPHRKDLYDRRFYACEDCEAWVGCHQSTAKPLGTPANAELRSSRSWCHRVFDPMWKEGDMTRTEAYAWLANVLGIPVRECHIGEFDLPTCHKVIMACQERELHGNV